MKEQTKHITVLGAGESGNGAAMLAQQLGYEVWVSDGGAIKPKYKEELKTLGISYEENGHSNDKILGADLVIKSPGIPEKAPIMKALRVENIEVISEIEFAFQHKNKNSKIIAITGSNGKTTTASMIYHLMKDSGADVALAGNIGYSFARQLVVAPKEWYVLEISSFQLDDIKSFQPDIAVLLNVTPDHLDRYDYDFQKYLASKFRITAYQKPNDILVLNADDPATNSWLQQHSIIAKPIYYTMNEEKELGPEGAQYNNETLKMNVADQHFELPISELTVRGKHNYGNSMAAGISAMAAGLRSDSLRAAFSTFKGLDHRLEFAGSVRGVDFINDSKGTNLNSVWYALESMTKPTVLILGGQDKGNDYNEIRELVNEKVKAIVCLGTDNEAIKAAFRSAGKEILETRSAKDAVLASYSLATKGDVVLLSPGCASFDIFENFEDRGRQFKKAVLEL